jgi:small membrane protein
MTAIKILLVLSFLGLSVWAFRNRSRVGLRAGIRLLVVVLVALAVASILQPDIPQKAADFLGVTRGTDLVLYVLAVSFAATSVGTYFRFREQERRLVQIVRAAAIRDAVLLQGLPGSDDRASGPLDAAARNSSTAA